MNNTMTLSDKVKNSSRVAWNKGIPRTWETGGGFIKGDKRLVGNEFAKGNKPNSTSFKKGCTPHNKGIHISETFAGIHYWINQELGQPNYCEHCGRTDRKQYDWANKDHEYKKVIGDWMRLCRSCHMKYDYQFNNRNK